MYWQRELAYCSCLSACPYQYLVHQQYPSARLWIDCHQIERPTLEAPFLPIEEPAPTIATCIKACRLWPRKFDSSTNELLSLTNRKEGHSPLKGNTKREPAKHLLQAILQLSKGAYRVKSDTTDLSLPNTRILSEPSAWFDKNAYHKPVPIPVPKTAKLNLIHWVMTLVVLFPEPSYFRVQQERF